MKSFVGLKEGCLVALLNCFQYEVNISFVAHRTFQISLIPLSSKPFILSQRQPDFPSLLQKHRRVLTVTSQPQHLNLE